ncbi:trypsin [Drosophila pseudoobscura]|uniref:Trypsin n=1 Tax=Drosophila pseudoobscura pseudoobscura TaxID=46245 RepID=A0A6I8UCE1_DROPS|nr:trypsin [Drosophila pseudoobscura]
MMLNPHALAIYLLLLLCGQRTWATSLKDRIVGGVEIPIQMTPWLASLSVQGNHSCGSALITPRWLVTAAHCVPYPERYSVRAGSSSVREGGQQRAVAKILVHPGFNPRTLVHDIALLQTREPFKLGGNVQLIKLPLPGLSALPKTLLVAGWGTVHAKANATETRLRGTLVQTIDQRRCRRLYGVWRRPITDNMLCAAAAGRDHCYGDSGSPLVHQGSSYGIVSFAYGCADPRFPGVYTRLANYVSWIFGVLKSEAN